jgi:hypothetical protein
MYQFLSEITAKVDVVLLPEDWLGATVIDWGDYQENIIKLLHVVNLSRDKSGKYITEVSSRFLMSSASLLPTPYLSPGPSMFGQREAYIPGA